MKTTYKIHPAIGVARLGNSPTSFCISAETTGGLPIDCDADGNASVVNGVEQPVQKFKDDQGRIRRQAARFRIYVYDDRSPNGRELKLGDTITVQVQKSGQTMTATLTDIQWTVYLANKKAAWYQFQEMAGEHGYGPDHPLRNPAVVNAQDRQQLVIDPGPRTVLWTKARQRVQTFARATSPGTGSFPPPLSPNSIDTLGEIRSTRTVEGANRLLVLGGFGNSGSYLTGFGQPKIEHYANNDGWFDDTSDGPVSASLVIEVTHVDGAPIPAGFPQPGPVPVDVPAWVIVGYPRYAPEIVDVITMDDLVYDLSVREFGYDTLIYGEPPFDGARKRPTDPAQLQTWHERATWNPDYYPRFWRDIWPILSRPFNYQWVMDFDALTGADPHQTARGSGGNFDPDVISIHPYEGEDPAERDYRAKARQFAYQVLRQPGQENRLSLSDNKVTGPFGMPLLCGDNPLTNVVPAKFLRLTETMLFLLRQWAAGKFINEQREEMPAADPPEAVALDRGVLGNVMGGSFCPGAEAAWIMRNPNIYAGPYRIKPSASYVIGGLTVPSAGTGTAGEPGISDGMEPGDVTKYSAQPWQSDFNECTSQDIDVTYENWNVLYPSSTGDPMLQWSWTTYWWPAHRPVKVNNQPWSPTAQNNAGDLAMVTTWSSLSFVAKNPDATVENLDPAFVMVEPSS